jgi:hypothetical protein
LIEFENGIGGKEESKNGKFTMKTIPRAREVGQSYASSIWTTIIAAFHSFKLVWTERWASTFLSVLKKTISLLV